MAPQYLAPDDDYRCSKCAVTGVKLWREYNTFRPSLYCADCCSGTRHKGTDQIGWNVPAVPSPNGSYWGYTSVPDDAADWWRSLPGPIVPFV